MSLGLRLGLGLGLGLRASNQRHSPRQGQGGKKARANNLVTSPNQGLVTVDGRNKPHWRIRPPTGSIAQQADGSAYALPALSNVKEVDSRGKSLGCIEVSLEFTCRRETNLTRP